MNDTAAARYPGDPASACRIAIRSCWWTACSNARRARASARSRTSPSTSRSSPGTFPQRPVMPGVMIIEALAQAAGILAFVTADVVPEREHALLLRRHRQGALPPAGGAGRPADPHGEARAQHARHLEAVAPRRYVGDAEAASAEMMVAPDAATLSRPAGAHRDRSARRRLARRRELGAGRRGRARSPSSAPDVAIGAGTRDRPARGDQRARPRIGADNHIFQFASIGDAPQDKKYQGEPTRLEIGDRNVFREFCTVNRGTAHDQRRHPHRQRQPVHGLYARRARLP